MILAKDWMTKNVITITKDKTILEVAQIMKKHNFGDLIVLEDDKPIGIITERDICQKAVAENLLPGDTLVDSIMTKNVISGHINDSIADISRRMNLGKIKKMPIMDEGKLVGIITESDLTRVVSHLQKDKMGLSE